MMKRILLVALLLLSLNSKVFATDWINEASCVNAYLMDESSGNVIDSCGSNDLTGSGTITYSQTGQFGTSINFTRNSYFEADVATDSVDPPFTFVGWGNPDDVTSEHSILWIGDKDSGSQMQGITMSGQEASDPVRAFSYSGSFSAATKTSFTTNFHHVAGVFSSVSNRVVYLDGVAGTASTASRSVTGEDRTAIGGFRDASPGGYFSGDIDEVARFSTDLDSTDINDIMDNGLSQATGVTFIPKIMMF